MAKRKSGYEERFGIPAQALFGNAAVDLDSLPEYVPGSAAPRRERHVETPPETIRIKPAAGSRVKEKSAYKPGISLFTVVGCMLLAVVSVFVLLANARLTQVTAEQAQLKREYARLAEENRILTVQYESAFDLAHLESYAVGQLGMTKPVSAQYVYLPNYTEDKVVIIDENLGRSSFGQDVSRFFAALLEYIA